MKLSKKNRFEDFDSANCEVCGSEHIYSELKSVKLAGFRSLMNVCKNCLEKNPKEQYKNAAAILKEISSTVDNSSSPEERLQEIRELLK